MPSVLLSFSPSTVFPFPQSVPYSDARNIFIYMYMYNDVSMVICLYF